MSTTATPSMNEANERDPFNNNSYGTTIDTGYKLLNLPVLDVNDFNERIIRGYEEGWGERDLPADLGLARSLIPAGTATLRDFSNISPEIPEYIPENCTGCMDCVTECPDTAILGKVMSETEWNAKMLTIPEADRERFKKEWAKTKKYYDAYKKKLGDGGMFNIIIDPSSANFFGQNGQISSMDFDELVPAQQSLEQKDTDLLIVDDQDFRVKNVR